MKKLHLYPRLVEDDQKIQITLTNDPLSIPDCEKYVNDSAAGAQCIFTGTVRDHSNNKSVRALQYSAYDSMAKNEMKGLAEIARQRWPVIKIAIHHRIGNLKIGDIAVIVAVSSAHRKDAFESCQWIMDMVKKTVPIWKKEVYEDGEEWVGAM